MRLADLLALQEAGTINAETELVVVEGNRDRPITGIDLSLSLTGPAALGFVIDR